MSQHFFTLAVDQRPWLTDALFSHSGRVSPDERAVTTELKHLVFEALQEAHNKLANPAVGILVDAELGPGVAERAKFSGMKLAIPVELAGQRIYQTEFSDLTGHIAHYAPDYVKVLVRYNPNDPLADREIQLDRLASVSRAAADMGAQFLFELLVPPVEAQPADDEFVAQRPGLTRQAMTQIAEAMNVDVWKLEPQGDLANYQAAGRLAAQHQSRCVLLGAGKPIDEVLGWIATAAEAGFAGFAVGRSLWWDAMATYRADPTTRSAGIAEIRDRYIACVQTFLAAA